MTFFSENIVSSKKTCEEELFIELQENEFETHIKNNKSLYLFLIALFIILIIGVVSLIPSFLSYNHTQIMGEYKNKTHKIEMNADILFPTPQTKTLKAVYN